MHGELPALFNKVTDSHSTLTLSTHSHQQSASSSKSNPPEVRAVQMYNEKRKESTSFLASRNRGNASKLAGFGRTACLQASRAVYDVFGRLVGIGLSGCLCLGSGLPYSFRIDNLFFIILWTKQQHCRTRDNRKGRANFPCLLSRARKRQQPCRAGHVTATKVRASRQQECSYYVRETEISNLNGTLTVIIYSPERN